MSNPPDFEECLKQITDYEAAAGEEECFIDSKFDVHVNRIRAIMASGAIEEKKKDPKDKIAAYAKVLRRVVGAVNLESFDYLMSHDKITEEVINYVSPETENPIIFSCFVGLFRETIFLKLVEKGADINRRRRSDKSTLLYELVNASSRWDYETRMVKYGAMLIEKGIDINASNIYGETALFKACEQKCYEWMHMLLFYNASATLSCKFRGLPILAYEDSEYDDADNDEDTEIRNFLFDYTFDHLTFLINLSHILRPAERVDSVLYSRIINDGNLDIIVDDHAMEQFAGDMLFITAKNFRIFLTKFKAIVTSMLKSTKFLSNFIPKYLDLDNYPSISKTSEIVEIFHVFHEFDLMRDLVDSCENSFSVVIMLVNLFVEFTDKDFETELKIEDFTLDTVTQLICLFLNYGLDNITSDDLDYVYQHYGNCELFWILLHLDFKTNFRPQHPLLEDRRPVMSALAYNPNLSLAELLENCKDYSSFDDALHYFRDSKLDQVCSNVYSFKRSRDESERRHLLKRREYFKRVAEKIRSMPKVPLLKELSRNVARCYVIRYFNVTDKKGFFSVLKSLAIGGKDRDVLSYGIKLYTND